MAGPDDSAQLPDPQRLDTLPTEILETVLALLEPRDLAPVLRVNTSLLTIGYPLLYRHLTLSDAHAVSLRPLKLPRLAALVLPPLYYVHTTHTATHDPSVCDDLLSSMGPAADQMRLTSSDFDSSLDELARSLRPLSLSDALSATSRAVPFSDPASASRLCDAVHQVPSPSGAAVAYLSPTAASAPDTLTTPEPAPPPSLRLLSIPATPHPNIREICPLVALRPETLVLRHAPLLYTRACYALHALRIPRAILAFAPDSAVVGTNYKYEVAPDGPSGFLRRFPNAETVVWVWAVREGEVWRPSPRPRNTEARRGEKRNKGGSQRGEQQRAEGDVNGQDGRGDEDEEDKEEAYVASTWVGRILSPAVFGALKRRCPAVREVVLVNLDALDPVAVVQDEPHTHERVGRVARRWVRGQVGLMGWVYGDERGVGGEWGGPHGEESAGEARVRCLTMREFMAEERDKGPSGVGIDEMETWFDGEACSR